MQWRPDASAAEDAGSSQRDPESREIAVTRTVVGFSVLLLVMSAVDLVTTEVALRLGAVELNPVMAPVVGTRWAVLVKLGLPAAVVLAAPRVRSLLVARALKLALIIYIAVVVFNVTQLIAVMALS